MVSSLDAVCRQRLKAGVIRDLGRTIMFTSLLCEARIWPIVWRRRLAYWLVGEKENLAFLVMLGLPILGEIGRAHV